MNNFKNIKLTDRDKYLLTTFIICCVLIVWLTWSTYKPTAVQLRFSDAVFCLDSEDRVWKARANNICYSEDAK